MDLSFMGRKNNFSVFCSTKKSILTCLVHKKAVGLAKYHLGSVQKLLAHPYHP